MSLRRRRPLLPLYSFYQTEGMLKRFRGGVDENRYHLIIDTAQSRHIKNYLDVGCAEGYYLESVIEKISSARGIGVDISLPKLLAAKKRFWKKGTAEFIHATWNLLPFRREVFDLVTFFEGVEHAPDPSAPLTQINQCIKKDGILILSCPTSTPVLMVGEILEVLLNKFLFSISNTIFRGHLNWFTPSKLQKLLSRYFQEISRHQNIPRFSLTKQFKVLTCAIALKLYFYIGLFIGREPKQVPIDRSVYTILIVLKPHRT